MTPQTLLVLALAGVLIAVAVMRPRRHGEKQKPKARNPMEGMREFGLRHPEFVSSLVLEYTIQNVILYRFIDGYLEEGGFRKPEGKSEENRLMAAARHVIKDLLTRPPIGITAKAETLEQAVETWRRAQDKQTE